MNVSRRVRGAGPFGHLLFVVVLALGVFVMHTVGHPDTSPTAGMNSASHASAATPDTAIRAHERTEASTPMESSRVEKSAQSASTHMPFTAMDMLSLCMAVMLGAWVLAGLLRSALTRRADWLANLLAQAPVLLRPNPPPRGPDLTQLSVLRL
ncbi:DUF6153 family protein [Streptomyces canus]|uniref:DUF6153 family protein n=1 Tax=Streptomyces canus TaxID=58343 RepID=UPI003822FB85